MCESVISYNYWHSENICLEHSVFYTLREDLGQNWHSDRFSERNSFLLYKNQNKLAGAMLRISDMWFPVEEKKTRGNQRA